MSSLYELYETNFNLIFKRNEHEFALLYYGDERAMDLVKSQVNKILVNGDIGSRRLYWDTSAIKIQI